MRDLGSKERNDKRARIMDNIFSDVEGVWNMLSREYGNDDKTMAMALERAMAAMFDAHTDEEGNFRWCAEHLKFLGIYAFALLPIVIKKEMEEGIHEHHRN